MKRPTIRTATAAAALCAVALLAGCAKPATVVVSTPTRDNKVLQASPILYQVKQGEADYSALAGSLDPTKPQVRTHLTSGEAGVGTTDGWLYLFGHYPRADGRLVHASATGTTMILATNATRDRVVFLCADGEEAIEVTSKLPVGSGGSTRTIQNQWFYIDARDQGGVVTFTGPTAVPRPSDPDPDGARALVEQVKAAVDAAGLGGWCTQP